MIKLSVGEIAMLAIVFLLVQLVRFIMLAISELRTPTTHAYVCVVDNCSSTAPTAVEVP
jgi:hypothetical protein